MIWPIPKIPEKNTRSKPKYKYLFILFTLAIAFIFSFGYKLDEERRKYLLILTIPIVTFIFFIVFIFMFIRYHSSIINYNHWEEEKEKTKELWKRWAAQKIVSLGEVNYTPDKDGVEALLKEPEFIPMYPDKIRNLHNIDIIDHVIFSKIDESLEKLHPGYRFYLSEIFLNLQFEDKNINELIYNQWNILPTVINDNNSLFSLFDNVSDDFHLYISIQNSDNHSKFISTQIFSSHKNKNINDENKVQKIPRIMTFSSKSFVDDLNTFLEYSELKQRKITSIWLSGQRQDDIDNLMIELINHKIPLSKNNPMNFLDLSYSTPSERSFLTYMSMITEFSYKTNQDQLFINFNKNQTGYICLINRDIKHD
nr:hypothetical protein [uncultured Moellerella sp.]